MEPIVRIENLTKDYETGFWKKKQVRALDGVSLEVKPGQIFGFLGGNGAGKTTTIKILMGLIFPTAGSASILGKDIREVAMHRDIGYCPENPYFYDYLTPLELLAYFGKLFGLDGPNQNKKTTELLTSVGLDAKDWNKQLRKFSKGMLQRVGLAQALINEPKIVFMDEPMSGLDPVGRREVRELIADLRERGTTIMMSTHILSDVEVLCDEVAILRNGKLAATGKLDDLLTTTGSRFEITFVGSNDEKTSSAFSHIPAAEYTRKPSGFSITVERDELISLVLEAAKSSGARLVSVTPIRRSLEELFVDENKAEPSA
jgi:ABC-2 type transport system ATP-binding protein